MEENQHPPVETRYQPCAKVVPHPFSYALVMAVSQLPLFTKQLVKKETWEQRPAYLKKDSVTIPLPSTLTDWEDDLIIWENLYFLPEGKAKLDRVFISPDCHNIHATYSTDNKICYMSLKYITQMDMPHGYMDYDPRGFCEVGIYTLCLYSRFGPPSLVSMQYTVCFECRLSSSFIPSINQLLLVFIANLVLLGDKYLTLKLAFLS